MFGDRKAVPYGKPKVEVRDDAPSPITKTAEFVGWVIGKTTKATLDALEPMMDRQHRDAESMLAVLCLIACDGDENKAGELFEKVSGRKNGAD